MEAPPWLARTLGRTGEAEQHRELQREWLERA
jgi:hypothetical protein